MVYLLSACGLIQEVATCISQGHSAGHGLHFIGAATEADYHIEGQGIATKHAVLQLKQGHFYLLAECLEGSPTDLDSKSRTWIDSVELRPGTLPYAAEDCAVASRQCTAQWKKTACLYAEQPVVHAEVSYLVRLGAVVSFGCQENQMEIQFQESGSDNAVMKMLMRSMASSTDVQQQLDS